MRLQQIGAGASGQGSGHDVGDDQRNSGSDLRRTRATSLEVGMPTCRSARSSTVIGRRRRTAFHTAGCANSPPRRPSTLLRMSWRRPADRASACQPCVTVGFVSSSRSYSATMTSCPKYAITTATASRCVFCTRNRSRCDQGPTKGAGRHGGRAGGSPSTVSPAPSAPRSRVGDLLTRSRRSAQSSPCRSASLLTRARGRSAEEVAHHRARGPGPS